MRVKQERVLKKYQKNGKISVGMLSLGCPKTLVDSELVLGSLPSADYRVADQITDCDVALLNTCAFIQEAKQESIDRILELIELKKKGAIKAIVVLGCLPQRYPDELKKELIEVDAFLGTADYKEMDQVIKRVVKRRSIDGSPFSQIGNEPGFLYTANMHRFSLTPTFSRYIKISEGCDHTCTFCTIPTYRGKHRSRDLADVVSEARQLVDAGAREIVLTGQDTTFYGYDLRQEFLLPDLLHELNRIEKLRWIRLLYAYPSCVNDRLIDAIASLDKVCHYIDMPLQHISDPVLKRMKRGTTRKLIVNLLSKIRNKIPDVSIRTTFIVGFPGETEADFRELLAFMTDTKFERMGMFTYSREEGSPAALLDEQIPDEIKLARYNEGMALQQKISEENNRRQIGRILPVLIERRSERGAHIFEGRSYMDAPDVDGLVYVHSKRTLKPGVFVSAKIYDAYEYDLEAEATNATETD